MLMRILGVAVLALVTTACSTLTYQEPAAGPRARVRFVTDTTAISVLTTYGDKNCSTQSTEWMRLRNGVILTGSPKRLGMPLWKHHDNAAKEVYVEANKTIYATFQSGDTDGKTNYFCAAPFWYSFEDGADYEVAFKWDRQDCGVILSKIVAGSNGPELREQEVFSNRLSADNRGCVAAVRGPMF